MSGLLLSLFMGTFILGRGAEIENARVIITGAANGIGYACAYDLLRKGAQAVAIFDIDVVNGTRSARKLIENFGENRVLFFPTDVSNQFQFEMDFKTAVQSLGGLDIMINNAAMVNEPEWGRMIDTNNKAVVQGTLMSFDVMGKHKGGRGGTVVNMGSIGSLQPVKVVPIYSDTKHAILGFSMSVAVVTCIIAFPIYIIHILSYDVTGVAVKTMCPGHTNASLQTSKAHRYLDFIDYDEGVEFFADKDLQQPEDVSKEVIRLIEEAPNGAVWVVEKDEPTMSLNIPNYREWGTPV